MKEKYIEENGKKYKVQIFTNGTEFWFLNGELHRESGPAFVSGNGLYKRWYLNGVKLTEEEWDKVINERNFLIDKIVSKSISV